MKTIYYFLYHILGFVLLSLSAVVSVFLNPAEVPIINFITFLPIFALSFYTILLFYRKTYNPPVWVILVSIGLYIVIGITLINLAFFILPNPYHRAFISTIFVYLGTTVITVFILIKKRTKYPFVSRLFTLLAVFMFLSIYIVSCIHCFTPILKVSTPTTYTIITKLPEILSYLGSQG